MAQQSVPAPIGGWNARDALDQMDPRDAISLINWFPQPGAVYGRGGSLIKFNIGNFPVYTLVAFNPASGSQKLLAGGNGNLYDVSTLSSAVSKGSGYTSDKWQTAHFNNKLVLVNGSDLPQIYDGTTVTSMVGSLFGSFAISSVVGSTSGGTIAAGTHAYRVSVLYGSFETVPSPEVTVVNTGTTSSNTINWAIPAGNPTGFKIYGRTAAGELFMQSVSATTSSFVDTGSITPSGAMPTTDTTVKALYGVMSFKGRAFYWAQNVQGFWYASAGAFQGGLNFFPLDLVFQRGGYVVQIISWSRDNGDGVDDLLGIISSNGEALVYQGLSPDTANLWNIIGRFSMGRPLSVRSHGKLASEEIIITTDGFESMDQAIVNQRTQEIGDFDGKIFRATQSATTLYASNFGWECVHYPLGNMFLVNVPISSTQSEQYVINTNTQAWARFTGWNATTLTIFGDRLYFVDASGNLWLADTNGSDTTYGYGDNNVPVVHDCQQAYVQLTQPGMKSQMTGVELVTNMNFPTKASVNIMCDYNNRVLPTLPASPDTLLAYWNTANWNVNYWGWSSNDAANQNAKPKLYSVTGYGFAQSLSYRYQTMSQLLIWYSTNYLFNQAS